MRKDVFLSFRGEQTRKAFLSHFISALKKKGITTFDASESSCVSLQALQESLVAIPVISKDHASLEWWMDDLAKIIECEEKGTLTSVPIFLELDSCDISDMLRIAEENAHNMQGIQRRTLKAVKKWLEAHVNNKTGFHSHDCKNDSELVAKATSFVSNIMESSTPTKQTNTGLNRATSLRPVDPVSQRKPFFWRLRDDTDTKKNSCLEELRALMFRTASIIIGICGIEGVGKTSLVRHVYDEISPQFQHKFFIKSRFRPLLDNSCTKDSLLTDLACEAFEASSFHGSSIHAIKAMIRHRKVLLVADGVDDIKHLKGIIKDSSWFGPGSRIIVITQDKSLLTQCGVKHIYELECPKFEEALGFFSEFAFNRRNPLPGFEDLSFRAVQVSNRLPHALKMLGSFLCNKEEDEWESTLRRLEDSHNNYATEVCRYIGADDYVPRRPMKVDQEIGVDEANRFPFYQYS